MNREFKIRCHECNTVIRVPLYKNEQILPGDAEHLKRLLREVIEAPTIIANVAGCQRTMQELPGDLIERITNALYTGLWPERPSDHGVKVERNHETGSLLIHVHGPHCPGCKE